MLLKKILAEDVYREDYSTITAYFQNHPVDYADVIKAQLFWMGGVSIISGTLLRVCREPFPTSK
jgi:hypothetical protein